VDLLADFKSAYPDHCTTKLVIWQH